VDNPELVKYKSGRNVNKPDNLERSGEMVESETT